MKKTAMLTATALVATIAFASPAAANSLSPQTRMQNTCTAAKPADTDQHTYAAFVVGGIPVTQADLEISRVTVTNIPGGTLLSQTPFVHTGATGLHGGSPNIHGTFESTATYSGGLLVQDVVTVNRETYTYGCRIARTNKTNNNTNEPTNLQIAPTLTFTVDTNRRETQDTVSAPDVIETVQESRVVCNSPGRKGGVWTGQNGYTNAACVTLAGNTNFLHVRSNSLPGGFVSGKPDHTLSAPADADFVSPLFDDTAALDTGE